VSWRRHSEEWSRPANWLHPATPRDHRQQHPTDDQPQETCDQPEQSPTRPPQKPKRSLAGPNRPTFRLVSPKKGIQQSEMTFPKEGLRWNMLAQPINQQNHCSQRDAA
jgi:hypothetical protein